VDRLTRKELKTDKFAAEFSHTVQFLDKHRRESIVAGVAIVVVALVAAGIYFYRGRQHDARQAAFYEMLRVYDATVGPSNPFSLSFDTQAEKDQALNQKLEGLLHDYPGSEEALMAEIYLGVIAAEDDRLEEAETDLRHVLDSGNRELASQAALSLAAVYAGMDRMDEGEQLLRNLIDNPTYLVSSEQATIALAELLADTRPEEARQLLEPLRGERSAVSRAALSLLGQLDPASAE